MTTSTPVDRVFLRNITFSTLAIGHDRWSRPGKPQPALVSVSIPAPAAIAAAAVSDDIVHALDYSALCKALQGIESNSSPKGFESADGFVKRVGDVVAGCLGSASTAQGGGGDDEKKKKQQQQQQQDWDVELRLPTVCKRVETTAGAFPTGGLVWKGTFLAPSSCRPTPTPTPTVTHRSVGIHNAAVRCIVGINPHERLAPQTLRLDLTLVSDAAFMGAADLVAPLEPVFAMAEASSYGTIEALAVKMADVVLEEVRDGEGRGWDEVRVVVTKPHAYAMLVDGPGVDVTRRRT